MGQSDGCPCYQGKRSLSPTIMKIYKDVFSGDELFSDTYPMKLVDDCIYEVYGKHETRTEGDTGADPSSVSGIDIVLNHRLTESGFGSKKDYTVYLKDYMKKIVTYLENNGRADEVDSFKKNINGYMKDVLGRFKDLQFFVGESMDNDAMIMIMDYKDYQGEERPFLIAFKHGLEEEKV